MHVLIILLIGWAVERLRGNTKLGLGTWMRLGVKDGDPATDYRAEDIPAL